MAADPAPDRPRQNSLQWRLDLYERAPQTVPANLDRAVAEREALLLLLRDLEAQMAAGKAEDDQDDGGS